MSAKEKSFTPKVIPNIFFNPESIKRSTFQRNKRQSPRRTLPDLILNFLARSRQRLNPRPPGGIEHLRQPPRAIPAMDAKARLPKDFDFAVVVMLLYGMNHRTPPHSVGFANH